MQNNRQNNFPILDHFFNYFVIEDVGNVYSVFTLCN